MSSPITCQKSFYFSETELSLVQIVPRHVAVIMDGNRRWEKRQILSNQSKLLGGHWAGAETLTTIVEAAVDLGIEVLTVYAFSTENWHRSPKEIKTLFRILETYLKEKRQKMIDEGVRFEAIGALWPFPESLRREIALTCELTKECKGISLVVALNYGARDEICRAMMKISEKIEKGYIAKEAISEELISQHLDTARFGDPDLLIRTSGEMRVSNFLLWQLAYTEVYMTDTLWPDFTPHHLLEAIMEFQSRQRRGGK